MIIRDPTIAERYARALFQVAKRQNAVAEVLQDAHTLMPMATMGARLQMFLDAPQIPTEDKVELMRKALEGRIHKLTFSLIMMLLVRGRIEFTGEIIRRFRTLAEIDQGIFEAQVATAKPLSDDERRSLQAVLEKFTGAHLRISYIVEPSLIGGVRFSYGEVLVDDTVRGKLRRLRNQLEQAARQREHTAEMNASGTPGKRD